MTDYVVNPGRGRSATHPCDGGSRHADRRLARTFLNYQIEILPIEDASEEAPMSTNEVYCNEQITTGCRPSPAVLLIHDRMRPELGWRPACEDCARKACDTFPHRISLGWLDKDQYVSPFDRAMQAAFPAPGYVDETVTTPEQDAAAEKILRSAYSDRAVYCHEWWCTEEGRLTPAEVVIIDGSSWAPACKSCASQRKADATGLNSQVAALDEDRKAKYLAMVDGRFAPAASYTSEEYQARTGAQRKASRYGPSLMVMGASAVLFLIGVAAAIASTAPGPAIWFAIFAGLGFFAGFAMLVHEAEAPYRAWKDTLSPQDRHRVEMGEAAAAVAATAAVAADIHHRHQVGRERLAASQGAYAQRQRDNTQQEILGQLRQLNAPAPGPADAVAALHERRAAANIQGNSNPLLRNGWS